MSYHVEFQVPGSKRWESAYGTYSKEAEAYAAMGDNKRELKAEGNPVGKFRVVEGPSTASHPINGAQWGALGLLAYLVFK